MIKVEEEDKMNKIDQSDGPQLTGHVPAGETIVRPANPPVSLRPSFLPL